MTETLYKRHMIERFNKRLHQILIFPVKQNERLEMFMQDMKEVFEIPDKVDSAYEKVNRDVVNLYRVAQRAREEGEN